MDQEDVFLVDFWSPNRNPKSKSFYNVKFSRKLSFFQRGARNLYSRLETLRCVRLVRSCERAYVSQKPIKNHPIVQGLIFNTSSIRNLECQFWHSMFVKKNN